MVRRAGVILINQQSPIRRGPISLLILAASLAPVFAAPSDALLREGAAKIESGLFGRQDLAQVERLLSRTRAGGERQALTLLLCRYYRELEEEPLKALPLVAPLVLDPAVRNEWRGRWRPAPGQTGAAEPVMPPTKQWKLAPGNLPAALELARIHVALGRHLDALRIADAVGKQFEALPRVLAAEVSAEAMLASAELKRSEEFYQFALSGLATLRSGSGEWLDPGCPHVKARIEKALRHVRALLEAERYGEGFIRYREARNRHLKEKNVPEAILLYQDLATAYPGTVYGEAGDAYACMALFDLTPQALAAAVQRRQQSVPAIARKAQEAKRIRAPQPVQAKLAHQAAAAKQRLKRLQSLPPAAIAAAHQQGLKLAEKRPFGLYRGEILVRLARDAFYRQLDPRQAQTLYDRAWRWLAEVRAHDAAIASFEVPAKARQVSQPPRTEIASEDLFGNMRPSAIATAAIVNRRTSPWYLDDLREQCAMALGFLAFHRGENDDAIQWYARLPALDQKTETLEKRNDWNNSRRLKWGAENGYLYAFPEELRPFSQRQRFAVLLADFHYVTERFTEAQTFYHRLLQGEFGRLSPQAADYPLYASASCTYRTQGRQAGAQAYLNVVQRRSSSLTGDRALHSAGMLMINMGAPSMRRQGEELLKTLASSPRRNDFVYRGRLNYGLYLAETGRDREAGRVLHGFPPHAAEYTKIAKFLLKDAQTRARARAMAQSGASQGVRP